MISINFNEPVSVKLTDYGKQVLQEHWKSDYEFQDDEGYHSFTTWELMQIFGNIMYMGNSDSPFEKGELIFRR